MLAKNKKAFTLTEVLICVVLTGILAIVTTQTMMDNSVEIKKKTHIRKAHNSIQQAIKSLLNSKEYPSGRFDTSKTSLFKDSFYGLFTGNVTSCYGYADGYFGLRKNACFQGIDNLVWYIPNTDFEGTSIVEVKSPNGLQIPYVPVTVYIDNKKSISEKKFAESVILYGVRRDGNIKLLDDVVEKELSSRGIKKEKSLHFSVHKELKEIKLQK